MGELTIRPATPDDADAIRAIYAPLVERTAVSFEEEVPSREEMSARIQRSHAWLVAEIDGVVRGYAYAGRFHPRAAYRWSVEISVYIDESNRKSGMGRALIAELLDRLRELGFVNAFAGTTLPNEGSIRLFESFGFERIALQRKVGYKLDKWHDVGWWELHLRPHDVPPEELRGSD